MAKRVKYNYSGNMRGMWDRQEWKARKDQNLRSMSYTRPAYSHIMLDYLDNQKRVLLDKTQWLWLNFTDKKARYGRMSEGYNEPATIWEYVEYMRNYFNKGIKIITFSQLKAVANFDGRRRKNRIYAAVLIDDPFLFLSMMNKRTINEEYAQMWRNLNIHGEYVEVRAVKEYLEEQLQQINNQLERVEKRIKY